VDELIRCNIFVKTYHPCRKTPDCEVIYRIPDCEVPPGKYRNPGDAEPLDAARLTIHEFSTSRLERRNFEGTDNDHALNGVIIYVWGA
jgi:hypothetical protein